MLLEELRGLPEDLGLDELTFLVAGFNGFVNFVVSPLALTLGRFRNAGMRRLLAGLMAQGVNRFARAPFGAVMQLEAEGEERGGAAFRVSAYHEDSYFLAAAAVVAGLFQYFEGALAKPGVRLMSEVADPARLIRDMNRQGVIVEESAAMR